tara:strand:- start:727 stop:1032 length:306 start_codon:yes stop_codon:yes gene_type:complete
MAKRKTPKVKDVIDITPKPEKITEEQLKEVQGLVTAMHRMQMDIGVAESRKHQILHQLTIVQESITNLQNDFEKEYGTFDVDMQTGVINYPKQDGKVDKKD